MDLRAATESIEGLDHHGAVVGEPALALGTGRVEPFERFVVLVGFDWHETT